jgi:hypothetical protein
MLSKRSIQALLMQAAISSSLQPRSQASALDTCPPITNSYCCDKVDAYVATGCNLHPSLHNVNLKICSHFCYNTGSWNTNPSTTACNAPQWGTCCNGQLMDCSGGASTSPECASAISSLQTIENILGQPLTTNPQGLMATGCSDGGQIPQEFLEQEGFIPSD